MDTHSSTAMSPTDGPAAEDGKNSSWFHFLMELTPDATLVVDSNGVIRQINKMALKLFGYEEAEIVGQPVEILVPETVRARHHHIRLDFMADPFVRNMRDSLDLMAVRKSGDLVPVSIGLSPLESQNTEPFILASIRDNSVIHAALLQARTQAAEMTRITETATDAIITVDSALQIATWNSAASRLFGYTAEEVKGQSISLLDPPDGNRGCVASVVSGKRGSTPGSASETEAARKDGSVFPIELSVSAWDGDDTRMRCVIIRDVTSRKQSDAAIRRALAQAEQFNKLSVNRELRMIELKNEVNELLARLGESPRYLET